MELPQSRSKSALGASRNGKSGSGKERKLQSRRQEGVFTPPKSAALIDKLSADKRRRLFKKVDDMMGQVRQAFRMTDADGDSVLTAEEIREMLMTSDKTITSEELATLEQFLWKHDSDGDKVLDYGEFVNGFEQFHDQLRDSSVKAAGMIAYQKLAQTGVLKKIFDHRKELLKHIMKRTSDLGFRECCNEDLEGALRDMHLNLSEDQISTYVKAANMLKLPRFDPTDILNQAAKRFDDFADEANAMFGRGVSFNVQETNLDSDALQDLEQRSLALRSEVNPLIEKLHKKMELKSNSIQRLFRHLDQDKSGFLDTNNIFDAFHILDIPIERQQAQSICDACDINQDGHIAFVDFLQLFGTAGDQITQDRDRMRLSNFRSTMSSTAGSTALKARMDLTKLGPPRASTPSWTSQFHQGAWTGPFANDPSSSHHLEESRRFDLPSVPQHMDPRKYKVRAHTAITGGGVPKTGLDRPGFSRGGSLIEIGTAESISRDLADLGLWNTELERSRNARISLKNKVAHLQGREAGLAEKRRVEEARVDKRESANIDSLENQQAAWMKRIMDIDVQVVNERKGAVDVRHFKGFKHATNAPTALFFKEGKPATASHMFDRNPIRPLCGMPVEPLASTLLHG